MCFFVNLLMIMFFEIKLVNNGKVEMLVVLMM